MKGVVVTFANYEGGILGFSAADSKGFTSSKTELK